MRKKVSRKVDFNLASEVFEDASLTDSMKNQTFEKDMVDIAQLIVNPYQPRIKMDRTSIEELALSIEENGLLQPVTLLNNHDETYTIVFGHRRVAAYEYLDKQKIEANVLNSLENNKLAITPIVENLQRKDMEPIETAMALNKVIKMGITNTQQELAKLLGISQGRISKLLSILKLNELVLNEISKVNYKDVTVLAVLNKVSNDKQLEVFNSIKNLQRIQALEEIKLFINTKKIDIRRINHGNNSVNINTKGLNIDMKNKVFEYIQKIEQLLENEK